MNVVEKGSNSELSGSEFSGLSHYYAVVDLTDEHTTKV
jgi:hypothetical protein